MEPEWDPQNIEDAEIEEEPYNPDVSLFKGSLALWLVLGAIALGFLIRALARRR